MHTIYVKVVQITSNNKIGTILYLGYIYLIYYHRMLSLIFTELVSVANLYSCSSSII